MRKLIYLLVFSLLYLSFYGQTFVISDDSSYTPSSTNALLEVFSQNGNKGILIPRLTSAQRTSIATNAADNGLTVYDTDTKSFWVWDGTQWVELGDKQTLSLSGNTLSILNGNSVDLSSLISGNAWTLAGNSISSGDFLGTTNNEDLVIKVNNLEKFRITTDGEVAIGGFSNPEEDLEIRSLYAGINVRSYNNSGSWYQGAELNLQTSRGSMTAPLSLNSDEYLGSLNFLGGNDGNVSGVIGAAIRSVASADWSSSKSADLRFYTANPAPASERMRITADGKVGIGTTTPAGLLDVSNTFYTQQGTIIIRPQDNTYEGGELVFLGADTNSEWHIDNLGSNLRFHHGGEEYVRITPDGKVGIGTIDPSVLFEIKGQGDQEMFRITPGSAHPLQIYVGTSIAGISNPDGVTYFEMTGDETYIFGGHVIADNDGGRDLGSSARRWRTVYATNGTINTSDARDKENISNLNYGLEQVMKLKPVSFYWKDKNIYNGRKLGFIAQDVQKVLPEVVVTGNDPEHRLGIFYSDIIPVLTKAIQEQQQEIEALKKEIENLKKTINNQ